jgi:hypothetical protein
VKQTIFSLAISVFFAALCYLVTANWVLCILVLALFLLAFIFLVVPLGDRYQEKCRKRHEAYRFVNSFVISLSVSNSSLESYRGALEGAPSDLRELDRALASLSVDERISYLESYFEVPFYRMFVSVYRLYLEQGGDVLELADSLLKEITRAEESGSALEKKNRKKLLEFSTLWLMSCLIMGFLRFGLATFYDLLIDNIPYQLAALSFFLLAGVSFVIFAIFYTGEKPFQRRKHLEKKVCE